MKIQYSLPAELQSRVNSSITDWQSNRKTERLWQKDASLWSGQDESKWLGWLEIVERRQQDIFAYRSLSAEIEKAEFESALLLGIGGSTLSPEVLAATFGRRPGFPELHMVDSADPAQVKAAAEKVNLKKTVVIVSSRTGSALESNNLKQYFFAEMKRAVGTENVARHFIAITDPGSEMERQAKADGFRHIFYGDPEIGGCYSALSNFGLVPATVMGLDVEKLLRFAKKAVDACKNSEITENPGALLGLALGECAISGRDKITFFTSPELCSLGAWLEQLIAESTGRAGKGMTPVDRESIADPDHYGQDRLFVYLKLDRSVNTDLDTRVAEMERAGHPVVSIEVSELYAIATQFFTWQIATAVAGSIMGINPFSQLNVEVEAGRLAAEYEKAGRFSEAAPILEIEGIKLFADQKYAATLKSAASGNTLADYLRAHLTQIHAGDYFAAQAYVPMSPENERLIQQFRHQVRDAKKVATCVRFGPHLLHESAQDDNGGPSPGVFLQITSEHPADVPIPGQKYTFGVVVAAQAAGDLAALQQRGKRALRVHLPANVDAGLKTLADAVEQALAKAA